MNNSEQVVRTRFAPSPTGYLHIGSLRTALFSYLFAKRNVGKFILRIEDTDQARFVEGAIEQLINVMEQLGIKYDEGVIVENGKLVDLGELGPYQQSKRTAIYKEYAQKLVDGGHAYYCFCDQARLEELHKEQQALKKPTMYDRKCRYLSKDEINANIAKKMPHVIRQAIPESGHTTVKDLVYKEIVWENKLLDDQVLLKSDGFPTYHLAVVVDDHLMQITHVTRGEDWIPSTPKHVLLYKAFNWDAPVFAHFPLILNRDKTKLSKRQNDVAVEDYLKKGYLKEALVNFVALLGWNPKTEQEIFSIDELIEKFEFSKINKSGAVFDIEKLNWINGLYIRELHLEKLTEMLLPYLLESGLISKTGSASENGEEFLSKSGTKISKEFISAVIALEKERLKVLGEISNRVAYFFQRPEYQPQLLIWKKANLNETRSGLTAIMNFIKNLPEDDFKNRKIINDKAIAYIAENNMDNGTVLWPLRVALSGMEFSPNPFEIMEVMFSAYGREEIIARIEQALKILE